MSTVLFKRGSTSDMNDTNIQDGLLFFNTETFKIYMDNGTERIQYGGDTDLISNAEDASLVNAFNAETSLGLFSQKATVVDSKANALSVTQNYIPLGCLAFKEALGTTNYSTVGNGTISGALVSLNTSVSNLNTSVSSLNTSVSNLNTSVATHTNQLNFNNTPFYLDSQGGRWGWNSSSARGAGTFHPFSVISPIGSGAGSYDVRSKSNWQSLTVNDFLVVIASNKSKNKDWHNGPRVQKGNIGGLSITITKSYSGGIFYVNGVISYSGELYSDDGDSEIDLDTSLNITSSLAVYCIK